MPIIIGLESINEFTAICVLMQSRLMRSGGWDKMSVAFDCMVNNKTLKTEAVSINQLDFA